MANILSLALKVNADASGVVKNLTPAERALEKLGTQAEKATAVFDKFAKDSAAAAEAQASLNKRFVDLATQLQGGLNAEQYAALFATLQEEVRNTANAFEEGVRVTRELRTEQEIHAERLAKLNELAAVGAISEETLARGVAQADAALAKASKSADAFADDLGRAGNAGLKFNELSGILAALPGPIGNIAGRFSGIASAAEGLGRVFNGGLNAGISTLASQFSSLLTPANIAAGAFGAAAAGATALVRGLGDLEGRIEQLGNAALRLGTDFQTIQVLNEAAARSGVAIDALAAGIQNLTVNIDKARTGTGDAAKAFDELGISQQELNTLDPAALAERTAQALQGIEDPARRAALATDTLGKAGLSLLPGFNAIAESEQSLRRFSAAISDVDRDRIGSLGQAFDNVKTSLAGLGQAALLPFAGAVDGVARLFADIIGTVNRLAQAIGFVLQPALDAIGKGFSLLGDGIAAVNGLFDYLTGSNQKATQEVRTLRAEMEEPLDAGFVKEFAGDLERINTSLSDAIDESAKFGQAGFDAALQYQESIKELERQLDKELINEETFRRSAAQAGKVFKDELAKIEQDAKLEIQVSDNAAEAVAKVRAELSKAIDKSAQLGQAGFDAALKYQNAIEELQRQFEADVINQESLFRGAQAAREAYEAQVDSVKKLGEEQQRLIEKERERIDTLLKESDAAAKVRDDLAAVEREQSRVSELLADPAATEAQISAAQERLRELEALQDSLADKAQAASQGFSEGFDKAFESTNSGLTSLIVKAEEFGPAAADAAEQLRAGIEMAQNQASGGILTKEAYDLEVERQKRFFDQRIEQVKQEADERLKAQKEVEDILFASQYGYNSERIKAAENLNLLNQDIAETEERIAAARASGDIEELNTLSQRLAALDQAAAREEDIASGRAKAREEEEKRIKKNQEDYYKEQQKAQDAYAKEQEKIFEEQRKAAEAEAKRQEERLRKLNTLGPQSISVSDVRTTEGANLVVALAANAQDPALIQARLQTKYLERISGGIAQAAANYFNTPVAIVGYSKVGGIG